MTLVEAFVVTVPSGQMLPWGREQPSGLTCSRASQPRGIGRLRELPAVRVGLADEPLHLLAAQCGDRVDDGTCERAAPSTCHAFDLTRTELSGGCALDDFVARLEASR